MAKIPQNRNLENPKYRRTVLSPLPIDAESQTFSKNVLTLDEAQKEKKLERFEIFAGRPPQYTDLIVEINLYYRAGSRGIPRNPHVPYVTLSHFYCKNEQKEPLCSSF